MKSTLPHIVVFVVSAFVFSSCSSVSPFRRNEAVQLSEDERRLWNRSQEEAKRFDASGQLYESPELLEYVNAVARSLLPEELRGQNLTITVRILKNPLLNAFALPHGAIYIHSGFLAKIENEAQLAAILSHELVHITHRHALQHFRTSQNTSAVLATLQLAALPFGLYGSLAQLMGALGATAAVSGYSRAMEREADADGIEIVVRAGYDPAEAPKLFEYLKAELQEQKIHEPFFFGTHPKLVERQESWSALVKERFPTVSGKTGHEVYAEKIAPVLLESAAMDLSFGRWSWAEQAIKRYRNLRPQSAEGYFQMGELFRRRSQKGDHQNAEKEYRAAIEQDPSYAPPYGGLGRIYLKSGRKEEARREFAQYLVLSHQAEDRAYVEQYLINMGVEKP